MTSKHLTGEAHKIAELRKLMSQNQHTAVLRKGKAALKKFPNSVGLHQMVGRSAIYAGQADKGIYHLKNAAKFEGQGGSATYDLGVALSSVGRYDEARHAFIARLRAHKDDHACADALACALCMMMEFRTALEFHTLAGQLDPTNSKYTLHLAKTLEQMGLPAEMKKAYEIALKIDPDSGIAALGLGRSHRLLGQPEAAISILDRAIERNPDGNASLLHEKALVLANTGDLGGARHVFQEALKYAPTSAELWYSFITQTRVASPEPLRDLRRLAKDAGPTDQVPLQSALAQLEHRLGNYEAAHSAYVSFNGLVRKKNNYSIGGDIRMFVESKHQYERLISAPETISSRDATPSPIFVVGMPRSGTSLMEAILSCHSDVTAIGESETMAKIARSGTLETHGIAAGRDGYLDRVAGDVKTGWFTDKMPLNFRFLGQIDRMFPDAKIIHMMRDPRAVAWSMYTTRMITPAYTFSYDTDELLAYFALYRDMMAYWHTKMPGRILNVCYEDLTADPDAQIPNILDAVGLPFEPACLQPEKNTHMVNTASNVQVRQPIYKGSSEAWRAYEPWAGHWLNQLVDPDAHSADQSAA